MILNYLLCAGFGWVTAEWFLRGTWNWVRCYSYFWSNVCHGLICLSQVLWLPCTNMVWWHLQKIQSSFMCKFDVFPKFAKIFPEFFCHFLFWLHPWFDCILNLFFSLLYLHQRLEFRNQIFYKHCTFTAFCLYVFLLRSFALLLQGGFLFLYSTSCKYCSHLGQSFQEWTR